MDTEMKETYTKDGKKLSQLIQEWINENSFFLYCKNDKKEIEYCRR